MPAYIGQRLTEFTDGILTIRLNERLSSPSPLLDSIYRIVKMNRSEKKNLLEISPPHPTIRFARRQDIAERSRFRSKIRLEIKKKERNAVTLSGRGKSAVGRQKGRERNLADRAPVTGRRLTDVFQFARPFTDRQKRPLFCKLQIAAAVSRVLLPPAWKNASPAILLPLPIFTRAHRYLKLETAF